MRTTHPRHAWSSGLHLLIFAAIFAAPLAAQISSTAPTSSQNAQTIDEIWQHASSKYDAHRAALLRDVHRTAAAGPFRADCAVIQTLTEAQLEGKKISSVSLLGSSSTLTFESQSDGLHIHLPSAQPGKYAYCFKINFNAQP
jgi:Alpha-L-fucosidase C-terminal domain